MYNNNINNNNTAKLFSSKLVFFLNVSFWLKNSITLIKPLKQNNKIALRVMWVYFDIKLRFICGFCDYNVKILLVISRYFRFHIFVCCIQKINGL